MWTFLALVLVCGLVLVGSLVLRQHLSQQQWKLAAAELDLEFEQKGLAAKPRIWGTVSGFHVSAFVETKNQRVTTFFEVRSGGRIPRELSIRRSGFSIGFADNILLGDPLFEECCFLRGQEIAAVALMNQRTRGEVKRFVKEGGFVRHGDVVYPCGRYIQDASALVRHIHHVVQVAKQLVLPTSSYEAALIQNALSDTLADVRLRNLELLCHHSTNHRKRLNTALNALGDPEIRIRLLAAKNSGAAGTAQLVEIACGDHESYLRIEALQHLAQDPQNPQLQFCLKQALASEQEDVVYAALTVVRLTNCTPLFPELLTLDVRQRPQAAQKLAQVLGNFGLAQAENKLLEILSHSSSTARVFAAQSLGEVGSVAAVLALRRHCCGLLSASELKQTALVAIDAIQQRQGDVSAGSLAVFRDNKDAGTLAVTTGGGLALNRLLKPQ